MDLISQPINSIKIQRIQGQRPNGTLGYDVQITFLVGQHGPFTLKYPAESYDAAKAKADMIHQQAQVRDVLQLEGQT